MNVKQKLEFLEQSATHFAADMLLKGTYGKEEAEAFKGCSIACHLHHIKPELDAVEIHDLANKHAIVANYYGYPEWMAMLQDTIFEGLPNGESAKWHVQLAETLAKLPAKYDWQLALHRVHAAILRIAYRSAGSAQDAVQRVLSLHERAGRGERITDDLWSAAASAAESAAESAAWSVAGSVAGGATWSAAWSAAGGATWSAAWSAAENVGAARSAAERAAESARSAAWSAAENVGAARSAAESARSAAWSAAYQEIRDDILKALRG